MIFLLMSLERFFKRAVLYELWEKDLLGKRLIWFKSSLKGKIKRLVAINMCACFALFDSPGLFANELGIYFWFQDYKKFWENFGRFLKLGCIEDSGNHKRITPLLRFYTSKNEEDLTSLDDYVENMGENQKAIYYLATDSLKSAKSAPFLEKLVQKDIEVCMLYRFWWHTHVHGFSARWRYVYPRGSNPKFCDQKWLLILGASTKMLWTEMAFNFRLIKNKGQNQSSMVFESTKDKCINEMMNQFGHSRFKYLCSLANGSSICVFQENWSNSFFFPSLFSGYSLWLLTW